MIGLEEVEDPTERERQEQEQEPDRAERQENRKRRERWQEIHVRPSWSEPTLGKALHIVKRARSGSRGLMLTSDPKGSIFRSDADQ